MKKTLRTLFVVLALTLCLCLPAFAQEAKPAQPAAKEDKTVTDLTGRDAFLRDVKGFTTNFGGPYVFEQASRKSPADIYGAAPAEGSVAVLRIYTMSDDKGDMVRILLIGASANKRLNSAPIASSSSISMRWFKKPSTFKTPSAFTTPSR